MEEHSSPNNHARALLALHATRDAQALEGAAPEAEELALLLEDRLAFTRRQEVISHINANPELFAQWMYLVEAQAALSKEPAATTSLWTRLLDVLRSPWQLGLSGAALAGIVAAIILLPAEQGAPELIIPQAPHPTPGFAERSDRNFDSGVQAGIALAFRAQPPETQQLLPLAPQLSALPVPAESHLAELPPQAVQLGEALLETHNACANGNIASATTLDQERLHPLLDKLGMGQALPKASNNPLYCQQLTTYLSTWLPPQ